MCRARLTNKAAYHHVMNRGHGGREIFYDDEAKAQFLDILEAKSNSDTEVLLPWSDIQKGKGRNPQNITEMSKSQVADPARICRVEDPACLPAGRP